MTDAVAVPQPWEAEEMNEQTYLRWAEVKEQNGKTLVVQTLVNGYQSHDGDWVADSLVYTALRGGEVLAVIDEDSDERQVEDYVVVERRVVNE
ncbi:hypothetical protein [Nocardioides flavescens]|uniref:Uncharacterized protein n=1 Tax=Nocardioides flavescens TaxID=2691959 RepID=A0A6L7F3A0_9ACTN|nr:hypothetical protein [Nocardioides flavescens]MXG91554.1 hypothetical protein [Nocardioides flavescens]